MWICTKPPALNRHKNSHTHKQANPQSQGLPFPSFIHTYPLATSEIAESCIMRTHVFLNTRTARFASVLCCEEHGCRTCYTFRGQIFCHAEYSSGQNISPLAAGDSTGLHAREATNGRGLWNPYRLKPWFPGSPFNPLIFAFIPRPHWRRSQEDAKESKNKSLKNMTNPSEITDISDISEIHLGIKWYRWYRSAHVEVTPCSMRWTSAEATKPTGIIPYQLWVMDFEVTLPRRSESFWFFSERI